LHLERRPFDLRKLCREVGKLAWPLVRFTIPCQFAPFVTDLAFSHPPSLFFQSTPPYAPSLHLEKRPFDLRKLCREAGKLAWPLVRSKGLRFSLEVAGVVPRYVVGDEKRLLRLMLHLIGRAVKKTDEGFVSVRVSVDDGQTPRPHSSQSSFTVADGPAAASFRPAAAAAAAAAGENSLGLQPHTPWEVGAGPFPCLPTFPYLPYVLLPYVYVHVTPTDPFPRCCHVMASFCACMYVFLRYCTVVAPLPSHPHCTCICIPSSCIPSIPLHPSVPEFLPPRPNTGFLLLCPPCLSLS
ncbi:unnamed protein product, partial [Closterium sp. NIES-53]